MTNRFETLELAEITANQLTETTGDQHIAYKSTYAFNPFVAARLPKVGEEVSMGFNGDYYPEGKIEKISKNHKMITTTTGVKFTRVSDMCWKQGGKNGAFSLVLGHRDERNPHF